MYSAATHPCRHRYFFGVADPDLACYRSNMAQIEKRLEGRNFRVRCGHCGDSIAGSISADRGEILEVSWSHDGSTWFGSFQLPATAQA